MEAITVQLPRALCELAGCSRSVEVEGAATLDDVLRELVHRIPALGLHLFDDTGGLRRHVRCFRRDPSAGSVLGLSDPVAPGDRLTLMHSVAGG